MKYQSIGRQEGRGRKIGWLEPSQIIEDAKTRVPTPIVQRLSFCDCHPLLACLSTPLSPLFLQCTPSCQPVPLSGSPSVPLPLMSLHYLTSSPFLSHSHPLHLFSFSPVLPLLPPASTAAEKPAPRKPACVCLYMSVCV